MNGRFADYVAGDGRRQPSAPFPHCAPDGSLWRLPDNPARFDRAALSARPWTLWRYREALPKVDGSIASMGEGATPMVELDDAGRVLAKLEYMAPTGSFKDRGAAVMVAVARHWGVTRMVVDSSGNAGAAAAAYAARAGIECEVFVPATNSPAKLKQPESYGAVVQRIDGTRADVAAAALTRVEESAAFYASHVYCPFFHEGTKTYALEIWEQLGGRAPDELILPVGNGTLVLGAAKGFRELRAAGAIERMPRITAVQAAACAPLAAAFERGDGRIEPAPVKPTRAEGIAIADPPRGVEILDAVRAAGGRIVTVDEAATERARQWLAHRGLYVETTAAVTCAAWQVHGALNTSRSVVLPLCGTGLKGG